LFLTSNLASEAITRLSTGGMPQSVDSVIEAIRPALSKHFKPALLARMTIVPFYALRAEYMKNIVAIKLNRLVARAFESHKIKLSYSDAVIDQIASRCNEVETGARNIDHIMRGTILPQISQDIISRLGKGTMPAELSLGLNADGTFSLDEGQLALKK
jgi:type VI secretion system protein VasG